MLGEAGGQKGLGAVRMEKARGAALRAIVRSLTSAPRQARYVPLRVSGLELSACVLDTGVLVVMYSITPERGTLYGPEYES